MKHVWKGLGAAALAVGLAAAGTAGPASIPAGHTGLQEMGCNFNAPPEELADRKSPADSSSLQIEAGAIKLCYSSPSARGRDIMGGLVPFGQPWRLGANEPTLLRIDFPARIGDVAVEPGSYALYAIPGKEEWTLAVNGAVDRWGVPIDESVTQADVGRTTVPAQETTDHVESLRLELKPADDGTGARLIMEWERTRIEVPIRPRG